MLLARSKRARRGETSRRTRAAPPWPRRAGYCRLRQSSVAREQKRLATAARHGAERGQDFVRGGPRGARPPAHAPRRPGPATAVRAGSSVRPQPIALPRRPRAGSEAAVLAQAAAILALCRLHCGSPLPKSQVRFEVFPIFCPTLDGSKIAFH